MAFDMYADQAREAIGQHEEFLLMLASADEARFPELSAVWSSFYKSPCLPSAQAGRLVHELLDLLACNGGRSNKPISEPVIRLVLFFSAAYRGGHEVRCSSD
ncbi:hypothetical protein [Paucibacter sp. XJ19-41]|uniref:hypothetical protein n=1 Tax=Paucibacter sp. XJ19-41 TaxID=2927824 RepID=UPI00234ADB46|nr:hypothetical protein [Paucibacter sp. XJ19-41]MDC6167378.1 hypothetical protein [Paucibacter sp. XJ19-41]